VDWTTIAYAVGVSLVSRVFVFSRAMLESRKLDLIGVLKESAGTTTAGSGSRLRKSLGNCLKLCWRLPCLCRRGWVAKSLANRFKEDRDPC